MEVRLQLNEVGVNAAEGGYGKIGYGAEVWSVKVPIDGGLLASRFAICWWDVCDEWDKWDIFKI